MMVAVVAVVVAAAEENDGDYCDLNDNGYSSSCCSYNEMTIDDNHALDDLVEISARFLASCLAE